MNSNIENSTLSTIKACERLGICANTLRNWANNGSIEYYKTPAGRRNYYVEKYLATKKERIVVFYSRVSSGKQKDDLQRQKKYIKERVPNKYSRCRSNEYSDIASGINFKRKSLLQILEQVEQGVISAIVVASKDRLARFGFELIEWICNRNNTEIVVIDQNNNTPEEQLGESLMSIVQIYCCRWNGKRRYQRKDNNKIIQIEIEAKQNTEETT